MHGHGDAGVRQNFCERNSVVLVRMHAAGRDEADKMAGAAAGLQLSNQSGDRPGALAISPEVIASSMRGRSCITTRPRRC